MEKSQHAIVLFDGVCNLCNGAVQFIIKRDSRAYFKFASLQSETGQQLLAAHRLKPTLDSFVVIDHGTAYAKSDAALRVCRHLRGVWPAFAWFRIVPRPFRDLVYSFVAANRYRWFGKTEQCMLPTPDTRQRFL